MIDERKKMYVEMNEPNKRFQNSFRDWKTLIKGG